MEGIESLPKKRGRTIGRGGKRLLGAIAFAAGALGTTLLIRRRSGRAVESQQTTMDYLSGAAANRWARPGMEVTFRAELKPGRSRSERTFRVAEILSSGRVVLVGVSGEHTESEFEPQRGR